MSWTDLRTFDATRWRSARLPESNLDVELARLHADDASGASLSLVRFPPGWVRDARGCYAVAEEMALLDGSLSLSGVTLVAGDYGYVPPRVERTATASPDGALVLAWFAGAAGWLSDASEVRPGAVVRRPLVPGPLRPADPATAGTCEALDAVVDQVRVDRDLLDVVTGRWCFVTAGESAPSPSGLVQQRAWSRNGVAAGT